MEIKKWDLKQIGLVLIIGFFILAFFIQFINPTKTFIASTSPDKFPFTLEDVDSFSATSLEDDHIAIVYMKANTIYYKESYTRGFFWKDPVTLLGVNNSTRNIQAKSMKNGTDNLLLFTWDECGENGDETSREIFYAIYNLNSRSLVKDATRVSKLLEDGINFRPSVAGDLDNKIMMSWIKEYSNKSREIMVISSRDLNSWSPEKKLRVNNAELEDFKIIMKNDGEFAIIALINNSLSQQVVLNENINVDPSNFSLLREFSLINNTVQEMDGSFTTNNELVISYIMFQKSDPSSSKGQVFCYSLSSLNDTNRTIQIDNITSGSGLQFVIFSNDQLLIIWKSNDAAGEISFSIVDFEMNNKNSLIHTVLLSYIFLACGIFNQFVYLNNKHLKKGIKEPLNDIFTTILFFVMAVMIMLPFSGFEGEKMGHSDLDGFIIPAPLNLATLIVIGFVGLFYLISTPLLDKYWKPSTRFQSFFIKPKNDQKNNKHLLVKKEILRKIPHISVSLLILGFTPIGSLAMKFAAFQKYDRYNFINEGAIIFDYILRFNDVEIGSYAVKLFVASTTIFLWILGLHILLAPKKEFFMKDFFFYVAKEKEYSSTADFVVMFQSIFFMFVTLTFNPQYKLIGTFCFLAGIMALCFGDTVAVFVGKFLGKHHLSPRAKKTWEGVIAGTLTSFFLSLFFISWPFALIVAGIYALVDLITPKLPVSDNILIPFLVTLSLVWFLPWIESPIMSIFLS
ncbi:MAG: phosphatidate cytidylyltransferase [Promethearchaeota archaeon]